MQNWKKRYAFLVIVTNFGKDIKKNACKNGYLGSISIPDKYMFRVCFESPFTKMISSLKYKWSPPPPPPPPGFIAGTWYLIRSLVRWAVCLFV